MTRQAYRNQLTSRKHGLLKLLELFSYTSATKTIDKLFALLHLASDGETAAFSPDYISSEEAVMRRYAGAFVNGGSALELLYRAGTSKSPPFCSWIPDWTRKDHPKTISTWHSAAGPFCASGERQLSVSLSHSEKGILEVAGTFVDRIAHVGNVSLRDSDVMTYLNHIHEQPVDRTLYPTSESVADLRFRLPVGNAARPHLDPVTDAMSTYRTIAAARAAPH